MLISKDFTYIFRIIFHTYLIWFLVKTKRIYFVLRNVFEITLLAMALENEATTHKEYIYISALKILIYHLLLRTQNEQNPSCIYLNETIFLMIKLIRRKMKYCCGI